jgi:large subunit ribosomal protein L18e|tara:strand:+ start:1985 stop:2353 length:369 start_codon:yes stop_codon:yes gene_type:complete
MEMKLTGPTNPLLEKLIGELKKRSNEQSINLWKRVASDLEKPTRQRRVVNLSKINRYTKEDETIVVPGKVLGSGALNHKLTISAYQFSDQAKDKLEKAGAEIVSLLDISKEKPNGKKIKIIG